MTQTSARYQRAVRKKQKEIGKENLCPLGGKIESEGRKIEEGPRLSRHASMCSLPPGVLSTHLAMKLRLIAIDGL
jgi:hypothetical protein